MAKHNFFAVVGDDDYVVRQRAKEIFDQHIEKFPDDLSRNKLMLVQIRWKMWKEF